MLELNQCYNMDCMKGMAQFPDGFFDLAVVDPPYFSGPERRGYYGSKVSKIGVHRDYPVSPVWATLCSLQAASTTPTRRPPAAPP